MKLRQILSGILLFMVALSSCKTTKKSSKEIIVNDRELHIDSSQTYAYSHIKVKDTLVTIPYRLIKATFSKDQLKPLYNDRGEAQARSYTIDTNGLKATITAMIDGSISLQFEADSLKIIVKNLIEKVSILEQKQVSQSQKKEEVSYREVYHATKVHLMRYWWVYVLLLAVIYIIDKLIPFPHKKQN